jgi:hypothetical protein
MRVVSGRPAERGGGRLETLCSRQTHHPSLATDEGKQACSDQRAERSDPSRSWPWRHWRWLPAVAVQEIRDGDDDGDHGEGPPRPGERRRRP